MKNEGMMKISFPKNKKRDLIENQKSNFNQTNPEVRCWFTQTVFGEGRREREGRTTPRAAKDMRSTHLQVKTVT